METRWITRETGHAVFALGMRARACGAECVYIEPPRHTGEVPALHVPQRNQRDDM